MQNSIVRHDEQLLRGIEQAVEGWEKARAAEAAAATLRAERENAAAAQRTAGTAEADADAPGRPHRASLALPAAAARAVLGVWEEAETESDVAQLHSPRDGSEPSGRPGDASGRWDDDAAEVEAGAEVDAEVVAAMRLMGAVDDDADAPDTDMPAYLEFNDPETGAPYWVNTVTGETTIEYPL